MLPSSTTEGQVRKDAVPIGSMVMYAADTAPDGWLLCDGSAVRREVYRELFGIIGTTYGVGDGSTTFNLPNLATRFPRGGTPGTTGGSTSHGHTVGVAGDQAISAAGSAVGVGSHGHSLTLTTALPPYLEVSFIIRAK